MIRATVVFYRTQRKVTTSMPLWRACAYHYANLFNSLLDSWDDVKGPLRELIVHLISTLICILFLVPLVWFGRRRAKSSDTEKNAEVPHA